MTAVNGVDPWCPAERVIGDEIGHLRDIANRVRSARQ